MSALAAETLSRVDAAEGLAALLAAEQAGNALDPNPAPLQPPPAMPMMPVHNYPGGYPYGVAHHGIGVPGISVAVRVGSWAIETLRLDVRMRAGEGADAEERERDRETTLYA